MAGPSSSCYPHDSARRRLFRRLATIRATTWTANPLGCLVMAQWVADGTAERAVALMREEAVRRTAIARQVFGDLIPEPQRPAFHVWIPMACAEAEAVARAALAHGIAITPPTAPIVDPAAISGLRISLGTVAQEDLEPLLNRLRKVMDQGRRGEFII